jgi:hypothetical protein
MATWGRLHFSADDLGIAPDAGATESTVAHGMRQEATLA